MEGWIDEIPGLEIPFAIASDTFCATGTISSRQISTCGIRKDQTAGKINDSGPWVQSG